MPEVSRPEGSINSVGLHAVRGLYAIPCDRCHKLPGFDFIDGWWFCLLCRNTYVDQVAAEAGEEPINGW